MKITYEPFEEIVVKDLIRFENLNDFLYAFAQIRAAGQPVALYWAEGVVFVHVLLQPITDELVENFLKGRLYYTVVNFTLKDQYESSLTYRSQKGEEVAIPIINVSSSQMLSEFARWLKSQT